jgi:hypothetical protein
MGTNVNLIYSLVTSLLEFLKEKEARKNFIVAHFLSISKNDFA